jgi:signal transduction histidine kinase/DNA-binding response OmpR family regulator
MKLLVIAADPGERALLRTALATGGHDVDEVADPLVGLEAVLGSAPDAVIVDLVGPGAEVAAVLDDVLELAPTAVIGLARGRRATRIPAGCDVVLRRPLSAAGLARRLEAAVRRGRGARPARQRARRHRPAPPPLLQRLVSRVEELRRQADTARSLVEAGRVLASTLELSQVLHHLAELVRRRIDTQCVVRIWLTGDDPQECHLHAQAGVMHEKPPERVRVAAGEGLVGWIAHHQTTLVVEDLAADRRVRNRDQVRREGLVSFLGVPLLLDRQSVGILTVATRERHVFSPDEVAVVEALATSAALALQNARLYSEATSRRREAEELARLARMLTESLDAADVADRIVGSALTLIGGAFSVVRLLQPDDSLRLIASRGDAAMLAGLVDVIPDGAGVVGRAVREGQPVWAADVLAEPGLVFSEALGRQVRELGIRGYLAAPLRLKRQIIGVVGIGTAEPRAFTPAEVSLLQTFADQAAIALENSRLYGELRSALQALEESHERVVRGERLRALGEMAAGVAHDFNNVLAIIVGRAEVLLGEVQDPDVTRHLNVIVKVALDAAQTVKRIQDFSRMRRGRALQQVSLSQLVDEVVEVTRSRWKDEAQARGLEYEVAVHPGRTPPIAGDPSELREVLTNVVFNALDAMPSGGRLLLATGADGDRVFCAITDTGTGMTEEVRQRIFDPYFTTKGERGTGLGLSVVYGIVTRHGGEVDVQSAPGEGTTFAIRLPLARDVVEPVDAVPVAAPGRRGRVLVIDDEKEVGDVLCDLLVREGHDVVVCAEAEGGLARLRQETFDLVVTDLGMPGVSGWEVARQVALIRPGTPVAMVTGWGDRIEPAEARARGVGHVLAKPFRGEQLLEIVNRALA